MASVRVDIIGRSVEKAHVSLDELSAELGSEDQRHAYRVLPALLHTVRDRLTVDEAAQPRGAAAGADPRYLLRGLGSEPDTRALSRQHAVPGRIAAEALLAGSQKRRSPPKP